MLQHTARYKGMVDKVRENLVRRAAKRQGYDLSKSRRRDPKALDFNGYMLSRDGKPVFGHQPHEYSATLDQIERELGIE